MSANRVTGDWRTRMKEMNDDSPEPGDSWKMHRRTEVLANRSKNLYRRQQADVENLYNVIIEKRPTQEHANEPLKQTNNVLPNENERLAMPSSSSPSPNFIEEDQIRATPPNDTQTLSFTNFLRSNNKTNICITSTPYIVLRRVGPNESPVKKRVPPPEDRHIPCSPKKRVHRNSFCRNENNDTINSTPRSSRVPSQSSQEPRIILNGNRTPRANIILNGNKTPRANILNDNKTPRARLPSPIVSSTVNMQENLLTSDEDEEVASIFAKPLEKIQFENPEIAPISSQNNVQAKSSQSEKNPVTARQTSSSNKTRSQIFSLQNEPQLPHQLSNFTQIINDQRGPPSQPKVSISTAEYLEIGKSIRNRANSQQSQDSTASSTRRKLYQKGNSINKDEYVHAPVSLQQVSEEIIKPVPSDHLAISPVRAIEPLFNGRITAETVDDISMSSIEQVGVTSGIDRNDNNLSKPVENFNRNSQRATTSGLNKMEPVLRFVEHKDADTIPDLSTSKTNQVKVPDSNSHIDRPDKSVYVNQSRNIVNDEPVPKLSRKRPPLSKQPQVSSHEDGVETNDVKQQREKLGENEPSNKPRKRGRPPHKQHITGEKNESESINQQNSKGYEERLQPSKPLSNHPQDSDFETMAINKSSNEMSQKQTSSNHQFVDNGPHDFETSSINQQSQERPSSSNNRTVDGQQDGLQSIVNNQIKEVDVASPSKKSRKRRVPNKERLNYENNESINRPNNEEHEEKLSKKLPKRAPKDQRNDHEKDNQATNEGKENQIPKQKLKFSYKRLFTNRIVLDMYDPLKKREPLAGTRHSTRTRNIPSTLPFGILSEQKKHSEQNRGGKKRKVNSNEEVAVPSEKRTRIDDSNEEVAGPSEKRTPIETVENIFSVVMSSEKLPVPNSYAFHEVEIASGFHSTIAKDVTVHHIPSFTAGPGYGIVSICPMGTKSACRIKTPLHLLVVSGSVELIINEESCTLNMGSLVLMKIGTKYSLRNESENTAMILFNQATT